MSDFPVSKHYESNIATDIIDKASLIALYIFVEVIVTDQRHAVIADNLGDDVVFVYFVAFSSVAWSLLKT